MTAASVAWLTVVPVKGLRALEVEAADVDLAGIRGDRRFVVVDERGHLVNGKRAGSLMRVVADTADGDGTLTLRFADRTAVSAPVRLGEETDLHAYGEVRAARAVEGPWGAALSAVAGFPVQLVAPRAPGDGLDRRAEGALTLLSTRSLAAVGQSLRQPAIDRRRFRMSVGVTGVGAFEEESWSGQVVRAGTVTMRVLGNVGRCAVTTKDPDSGVADLDTLGALRALREGADTTEPLPLGVWASVLEPGRVRVGDAVVVER